MLRSLWPDVRPGSQLAFVLDKQGQFWYRASAAQKALFHLARASQKRSARAFWPSGSIPARNILSCVSS
jgi:hypothetical protein